MASTGWDEPGHRLCARGRTRCRPDESCRRRWRPGRSGRGPHPADRVRRRADSGPPGKAGWPGTARSGPPGRRSRPDRPGCRHGRTRGGTPGCRPRRRWPSARWRGPRCPELGGQLMIEGGDHQFQPGPPSQGSVSAQQAAHEGHRRAAEQQAGTGSRRVRPATAPGRSECWRESADWPVPGRGTRRSRRESAVPGRGRGARRSPDASRRRPEARALRRGLPSRTRGGSTTRGQRPRPPGSRNLRSPGTASGAGTSSPVAAARRPDPAERRSAGQRRKQSGRSTHAPGRTSRWGDPAWPHHRGTGHAVVTRVGRRVAAVPCRLMVATASSGVGCGLIWMTVAPNLAATTGMSAAG